MINVKKLKKPSKRSGYELKPGQTTSVRGLVIVNKNSFCVYVDKYTPNKPTKGKKK